MDGLRPIPEEDFDTAGQALGYAFAPGSGPDHGTPTQSALIDLRGLYDDGQLRGVCKLYELTAWVRGELTTIGGIGGVAVPPEHRSQGVARRLCRGALQAYRDQAVGLVALWPFATAFYRQFGWATANEVRRYECEPAAFDPLAGAATDCDGQFRQLTVADWQRLRGVEAEYGRSRSLAIRRSERWWRERTFADWDGGRPYCYGYEVDDELQAYLLYTIADGRLTVQDLVYRNQTARQACLAYLGRHNAQVEQIVLYRTADSELLGQLDPAAAETTVSTGAMVRLAEPAGLEAIDWPETTVELTLRVTDPLFEDGSYTLSVTDGTASLSRLETVADEDATVDIGTLSQLAVGTHSVAAADRLGGLVVHTSAARDTLQRLFRPQSVGLRAFF
jgi:Predicted acetyltransferase involved in intracellular survival and related acetyltransferases